MALPREEVEELRRLVCESLPSSSSSSSSLLRFSERRSGGVVDGRVVVVVGLGECAAWRSGLVGFSSVGGSLWWGDCSGLEVSMASSSSSG